MMQRRIVSGDFHFDKEKNHKFKFSVVAFCSI